MPYRYNKYIHIFIFASIATILLASCDRRPAREMTPWGTVVGDTVATDSVFGIDDVQASGELIMLTVSGPETYYDYHGRGLGTQYLLCERFAQSIGVGVRVELCKDSAEAVARLDAGEGDIAICQQPKDSAKTNAPSENQAIAMRPQNYSWVINKDNSSLREALSKWYKPQMVAEVMREEKQLASAPRVRRRVFSPMLDSKRGTISHYDHLFRRYAPTAGWDWRLVAAQCYQESCFDPQAKSWAGACGLMQIMPSTADLVGLDRSRLFQAEPNIEAACRYIAKLNGTFSDIRSSQERVCFVLAAYNGGANHVRDAMALTRKYGGNPQRWADVSPYILRLRDPHYYRDPAVKYGYMRGDETEQYVSAILNRYYTYSGQRVVSTRPSAHTDMFTPQPATKKHRFK